MQPYSSQDKPKPWVIMMSIGVIWAVSFLLALVPLASEFEETFAPKALVRRNPFLDNVVVSFDDMKSWALNALNYDPWFTSDRAMEAVEKINTATSYGGIRSGLGDARIAEYVETNGLFG